MNKKTYLSPLTFMEEQYRLNLNICEASPNPRGGTVGGDGDPTITIPIEDGTDPTDPDDEINFTKGRGRGDYGSIW